MSSTVAFVAALILLLGHLVESISGEQSRLRLLLMRIFARWIEVPLLHFVYLVCVGRLKFLTRTFLTRWIVAVPMAWCFGRFGDTARPVPTDELLSMIDELPGRIAVGPCRCRIGHKACSHPLDTDIVIKTGTDVWLDAFPNDYRVIDKEEARAIVSACASIGMFHMVFLHCPVGGAVNEYVICNCCTDGCVPYILNRCLGKEVYRLVPGDWIATADPEKCMRCGTCVISCPFGAREFEGGVPVVRECLGCGICRTRCPTGATRMEPRDQARGLPGKSSLS